MLAAGNEAQIAEIRDRRRKAMVAFVYCGYGDESRDDTLNRVYAVAGVFGHKDEWDAIEGPWKERLGGRIFHAADCEFGHREFSNLKPGEGKRILRDLTMLVAESKLCGWGTSINLAEYREAFPNDFEDAPYLWGFGDVVRHMAELASVSLPRENTVELTFDRNEPIEYNAASLYEFMRVSRLETGSFLSDKLSFASRRSIGIQVADLLAREVMKRLDGRLSGSGRAVRLSFTALHNTRRFVVSSIGKAEFEAKKKELHGSKYRDLATLAAYKKWLDDNRLKDCLTNRIEHLKLFMDPRN